MGSPTFWEDNRRAQELIRERSELARLTGTVGDHARSAEDLAGLIELATEDGDHSLEAEIGTELAKLRTALDGFELKVMLSGPHDGKAAVVSIHPGGGTESQDWAQMLMRMYCAGGTRGTQGRGRRRAPRRGSRNQVGHHEVSGEYPYGYRARDRRAPTGPHPPLRCLKRRQTSFASVSRLRRRRRPEVVEGRYPGGRLPFVRAAGRESTPRTPRCGSPSFGIVVACQNERSQLRNRDTACGFSRRGLRAAERKHCEELAELAGQKKEIAFGSQIRSYTFHPYQLVKDHRTGLEIGNVEGVMDGDLDELIKAYLLWAKGRA
jgi:peptide chain release factor 2